LRLPRPRRGIGRHGTTVMGHRSRKRSSLHAHLERGRQQRVADVLHVLLQGRCCAEVRVPFVHLEWRGGEGERAVGEDTRERPLEEGCLVTTRERAPARPQRWVCVPAWASARPSTTAGTLYTYDAHKRSNVRVAKELARSRVTGRQTMVLACSALFGGQAPFAVGCRHGGTISPTSPRLLLEWLQACAGIRLGLSYYTPQLASTQAVALLLDVTPILSRPTPSSFRHCCLSTTSPARRVLLSVPLAVHYHPLAFWYAMCVDCRRLRTRRISPCPKRITASTPSGVIVTLIVKEQKRGTRRQAGGAYA